MILIIYISLTLLVIWFCHKDYKKGNDRNWLYITCFFLSLYQLVSVLGALDSDINKNASSYHTAFWIGYFWASLLALTLSSFFASKGLVSTESEDTILNDTTTDIENEKTNSFIKELSTKTNLPDNICKDIYYILTNFDKSENDIANNLIKTKLIPDLKINNNYGQVGIAFGCLICEKGLTQEQANEMSTVLITEMVNNTNGEKNGN